MPSPFRHFEDESRALVRRHAADAEAAESGNDHVPVAPLSSTHSPAPPTRANQPDGHPVRAAILIALAVFISVAALVYAVYYFSVRREVERSRPPAPAIRSMK